MPDAAEAPVLLIPVREEKLDVSMSLPDGWTVEVDGGSQLTCVADDAWERDGFRPSITVARYPHRSRSQIANLAQTTLSTMRESPDAYPAFQFRWARDEPDRILRCYDFVLPGTRRQVRQVQGLVAGHGLFVVNCTEAADPPRMEETFVAVIRSVTG